MRKSVGHTMLFSLELAVLLAVIVYPVSMLLPVREWAHSNRTQEFCFTFADGQVEKHGELSQCVSYYKTFSDRVFSERQKVVDSSRSFVSGGRHVLMFPPRLMEFRLDFYPKDRKRLGENVPVLANVRLGGKVLPRDALVPFRYPNEGYYGYTYTYKPLMNGWWRVLIPAGAVIWLAVVAGAWVYFRRQEIK